MEGANDLQEDGLAVDFSKRNLSSWNKQPIFHSIPSWMLTMKACLERERPEDSRFRYLGNVDEHCQSDELFSKIVSATKICHYSRNSCTKLRRRSIMVL